MVESTTETVEPTTTTELSRDLSLFHVTMMGVGMMIGAGVFLGIGNAMSIVGPGGTMLTFALNGVIAICSAMSYAELSSAVPRAGGAYNFARIGFGRTTSFYAGWMEWFASSVAGSVYALTFGIYVLNFLNGFGWLPWQHTTGHFSVKIVALLVALFFVYINYRGASETGRAGAVFTLGQTLALALIAVAGIVVAVTRPARLANFQPFLTDSGFKLFATMGFTYVAFEGFEVIAQAGDETINPRRNLPKAMLLSVVIVVVTYIGVTVASVVAISDPGVPPWGWVGAQPEIFFAEAVSRLLPFGGVLVTVAVVFAATSALNATTYSATRAVYALGRDRFLPGQLARLSARRRTPHIALMATAVVVILTAMFLPTRDVASSASIMFLLLFLLVNVCALRMRRRMGDELHYGYVMPLFPIPPLVAIVAQIVLAVHLTQVSWKAWVVAPAWLAVGGVSYWFYGRKHVVQSRDEILTIEEAPVTRARPYLVLLPVANPDNALANLVQTMGIAEANDAQVELLNMVEIPDQIPLSDARHYANPGREAIAEAMLYLASRFPVSHTVRYCRNTARGILSAAREHQADMIILGWRGKTRRRDFLFGSTVDPVLERNPCDVVVLKGCHEKSYARILVPFAGGPHSALAMRLASILVTREGGTIVPFNVAPPGVPTADIETFLERNADQFACPLELFEPKYHIARQALEPIVAEAAEYDLVIIGATGERRFRQLAVASLPELLAARVDTPLIMVKAKTPVRSWVNRWF